MQCIVCLDLDHHCAVILLAKMLISAPFSQSMCTFSFCINPCIVTMKKSASCLTTNQFKTQYLRKLKTFKKIHKSLGIKSKHTAGKLK